MQVEYRNQKLRKICTDASRARKVYGREMAIKIHQRIDQLEAVDTVETLVVAGIGRCHLLDGNRKGQFAMDLVHPHWLVFTKREADIEIACIEEITDYH